MKRLSCILIVLLMVVFAGCQQSQEKQTAEVSRKDRLVGNENLGLRNELISCKAEIEKQKNLVRQCEDEKAKADEQYGENTKWLMDKLPKDLMNNSRRLEEENTNLQARITELEKALEQAKAQQQQK